MTKPGTGPAAKRSNEMSGAKPTKPTKPTKTQGRAPGLYDEQLQREQQEKRLEKEPRAKIKPETAGEKEA